MTLSKYLSEQSLTHEAFGILIGTDRKTVWRYARGLCIPRPERMRRIVEVTGGKVGPQDFLDDHDEQAA